MRHTATAQSITRQVSAVYFTYTETDIDNRAVLTSKDFKKPIPRQLYFAAGLATVAIMVALLGTVAVFIPVAATAAEGLSGIFELASRRDS